MRTTDRRMRRLRWWAALTVVLLLGSGLPVLSGRSGLSEAVAFETTSSVKGAEQNQFHAYVRAGERIQVAGAPIDETLGVTITVTSPTGTVAEVPPTGVAQTFSTASDGIWLIDYRGATPRDDKYDWTIRVFDGDAEQTGRVWSYAYRRYDSTAGDFTYWVVNDLGYLYRAELTDYRGIFSLLQATSVGWTETDDCTPTYSSVDITGGEVLTGETLPVLDQCGAQYRVFLEEPDPTLPATGTSATGTETIVPSPLGVEQLQVSPMRFTPDSTATQGTFRYTIDSRFTGGYLFQVDADGNGSYDDPVDRVVQLGADGAGEYEYVFDGLDGRGRPIAPDALPSARLFFDKIGEMHMVQIDVEGRDGLRLLRTTGPSAPDATTYWDDSVLSTDGRDSLTEPMASGTDGVASTLSTHGWSNTGTNPWGNDRIIDDWTYAPAAVGSTSVTFGGQQLGVTKESDLPDGARPGDTGHYTVTMTNTGRGDFTAETPATLIDDLGAAVDDLAVDPGGVTATVDGADVSAGLTSSDTEIRWQGALAAGASVVVTIPVTVIGGGDGSATDTAWAHAPWDVTTTTPACDSTEPAVACVTDVLPRLVVHKAADTADQPAVGDRVHYTVTVGNAGPGDTTDERPATVVDDLGGVVDDATLVPDSLTADIGEVEATDGGLRWSGTLAAGGTATIGYDVIYRGGGDNTLVNSACVPEGHQVAGEEPCRTVTVPGRVVSSLDLAKTATLRDTDENGVADPGESIGYAFTVVNTGNTTVTGLTIDDPTIAADGITISCDVDTLAPGRVATCATTADRPVTEADLLAGSIENTATAVATDPDGGRVAAEDRATVPSAQVRSALTLAKHGTLDDAVTPNGTADLGEAIRYGVELTNTGNVTLHDVRIVDPTLSDAGLSIEDCPASLAPGESAVCWATADYPVTQQMMDTLTVVANTAWATATDPTGRDVTSPESTVEIPVTAAAPALRLVKHAALDDAVTANDTADAGESVRYSFELTNSGSVTLGELRVEDPMLTDAGIAVTECRQDGQVVTSLAPGATAICDTDDALVMSQEQFDALAGTSLSNTAVAYGTGPDRAEVAAPPSTTDTPVTDPAPALTLSKEQGTWTDVNGNGSIDAGDTTSYLFRVRNTGTVTVSDIAVTDPLLTERGVDLTDCHVTTLAVGSTTSCESGPLTLDADDAAAGHLLNTATATGATGDGTAISSDPATHDLPLPDVEYRKSVEADSEPVLAGSILTYTIALTNHGAAAGPVARDDVLSDVLDDAELLDPPTVEPTDAGVNLGPVTDGRFAIDGTLAPGATATVTYRVRVLPDDGRGSGSRAVNYLVPRGEDAPDGCAPEAGQCTDTPLSVLRVLKSVDAGPDADVQPGQRLTYTLTFGNEGTASVPVDRVDDLTHVLDDAAWVPGSEHSSDLTALAVEFTSPRLRVVGRLDAGASVSITYQVVVNPAGELGDHVLSNYVLAPDQPLPDPRACTGGGTCTVGYSGELGIGKTSSASSTPLVAGSTVDYVLTFANSGAGAVPVDHRDDLTGVLDDADWDPTTLDVSAGLRAERDGEQLVITGSVAADSVATVRYRVTVRADADRTGDDLLINHLLAAGDPGPGEVCAPTVTSTCDQVAQIEYAKTVAAEPAGPVVAGSVLTYTVTVRNAGQGAGVVDREDVLGDVLDDAALRSAPVVTPADAGVQVGPVTDGRFAITGALGAGAEVTITYQVEVLPDARRSAGSQAVNWLVEPGTAPDRACRTEDPACTATGLPMLSVTKTSDPESGSHLEPGDRVDYTVSFRNTGTADAPVDRVDDLTQVLDDAALAGGSVTSSDPEQVTAELTGSRLALTGAVAREATVTVTYSVIVRPDGQQGDHLLTNHVLMPDDPTPTECLAGAVCVTHFAGDLAVSKTAVPSATPLLAGDTVEYELRFTNSGTAPATVSHIDDLTQLVDDAVVGAATVDDALTVTAQDDRLVIGGAVPAGSSASVRYTATVRPDAERGDNLVVNHLVADPDGTGQATTSEPPDPDGACTSTTTSTCHEVAQVVYTKSVVADPATLIDDQIVAGTLLRYTITAHNQGRGVGVVQRSDDLSDVLDDADLATPPVSDNPAVRVSEPVDGSFTLTGSLGTDQSARVTYTVRVRDEADRVSGDATATNRLLLDGEETCDTAPDACTSTPLPRIGYAKSVELSEDGSTLAYTITVTNGGTATGVVDREDVLTDVLDDAALTGEPETDQPTVTITPVGEDRFALGGTLAAGAVAHVTYTATVRPDAERATANAVARNALVRPGDPARCGPDVPCTSTPLPLIRYDKSVSAEDSPLVEGSVLRYRITATNAGSAPGRVTREDDLSDVLDDAELLDDPVSDTASVRVTPLDATTGRFGIDGTLDPGATATITYRVRVVSDADRVNGNDLALNVVVPPGEPGGADACGPDTPCTSTPIPRLTYTKDVVADSDPVVSGTVLTYTVTATNAGSGVGLVDRTDDLTGVLDDAALLDRPALTDGPTTVTVSPVTDGRFDLGGTLEPGETATIRYRVRVLPEAERSDGDRRAVNLLIPGHGCTDSDDCGARTETPLPFIEVTKTVDPASGTSTEAGQELTYTVQLSNTGTAAERVERVDDLGGVLDDADLVADSIRFDGGTGWTMTREDASRIAVSGTLDPGRTVTLTYRVTVRPQGALGDHVLLNRVLRPAELTSTGLSCLPDQVCTSNPVGEVAATKTSDPESGTTVHVGDVVRYALTFGNVGEGTAGVAHRDDLSAVLDDAELTEAPTSSDPALAVGRTGDQLVITGTLAPHATVTVRYAVTVRAQADRGDAMLTNQVLRDGEQPTVGCDPGRPCTQHPVADDPVPHRLLSIPGLARTGVALGGVLVAAGCAFVIGFVLTRFGGQGVGGGGSAGGRRGSLGYRNRRSGRQGGTS